MFNSLFINTRDIVLRFYSPVAGKVWGPAAPLEFGLLCYINAAWLVILRPGDEGNSPVQPLSSPGSRRTRLSAEEPALGSAAGRPSHGIFSVSFHQLGRVSRDAGAFKFIHTRYKKKNLNVPD